ncbi:hypothetical protein C8R44DRAFT_735007 [Mycena epipterygia]|nr:hypothetical protein C8R44DRAFT_735007 [Mycena epipterygia]
MAKMKDLEKQEVDSNSLGTEEACAKMWSVYISQAERYDKALVAGWRADMKGILIFAGLFSGSLTAFIIESYPTLTPDSGDTMVLLLTQISRQLNTSATGIVPATPLEFTPTTSALVCNGLWFTSLGLSLASAVIATLVEQWARDYLNKADMRPAPIERARICSYLYSGLKRFRMHAVVDLIPLLLHMSLLLFFAGLVAFLHPINRAMMLVAASLLGIVAVVYAALTVMPLLFANCPCRTPLSGVLWRIGQIYVALSSALRRGASQLNHSMEEVMMHRATADSGRRTERDKRALCWTLKSLTAEHELEPFVEAIPQVIWSWTPFTRRRNHDHLLQTLIDDPGVQLAPRIAALLLTCETGLLEKGVRQHRTILCLKALLSLAMAAEVGPQRSLVFPFDPSIFIYLSKTDYGPAQPYLPALRFCGAWSLFCSFLTSVERLIAACDAEMDAKRDPRPDPLLAGLREVVQLQRQYTRARGSPVGSHLEDLMDIFSPVWFSPEGCDHIRQTLQRLFDSKTSVQADLLRGFLLDSARSEHQPYNFRETIAILRPDGPLDVNRMPADLGSTFRVIVDKFRKESNVNHVDRAIGVYLPLFDSFVDTETETCVADALIMYLNYRDLPDAVLRVLRDCDVALVWSRVTRRVARRDQPDDVLTALWRLCDLFLDPRFRAQLISIPLQSFVDAASALPVSQYTSSIEAMLRTVVLHAAETIHIPNVAADNPCAETSFVELKYLSMSGLLPTSASIGEDGIPVMQQSTAHPDGVPPPGIDELRSRISEARLALLLEFTGACASALLPHNAASTLAHIGSAAASTSSVPVDLQIQFSASLRSLVSAAEERLLQTVLECPLVSGLQWIDSPAAISAMRRALDGAFLSNQQLPIIADTLARLRLVEDMQFQDPGTT